MEKLKEEFSRVEAHDYELSFIYPDEETRKHLKVINRDLTAEEQTHIKGAATNLSTLVTDIAAGRVRLDDLPKDDIDKLRELLSPGAGTR